MGLLLFTGYVYKDVSGNTPQRTQTITLPTHGARRASFTVAQDAKAASKSIAQKVAASLPGAPRPGSSTNHKLNPLAARGTLDPPGVQQAIERKRPSSPPTSVEKNWGPPEKSAQSARAPTLAPSASGT